MSEPQAQFARLPLHLQKHLSGATKMVVQCPRSSARKTLNECVRCDHCRGLALDPDSARSYLVCNWHATDEQESGATTIAGRTAVSEIMTRQVVCAAPEMSAEALALMLVERNISGVPVIAPSGDVLGIASKSDLVRDQVLNGETTDVPHLGQTVYGHDVELGPGWYETELAKKTVAEIMTPIALTIPEKASVARAAAFMTFEHVHRVPVVDEDGNVVGILSTLDVLRWLAQQEGFVIPEGK